MKFNISTITLAAVAAVTIGAAGCSKLEKENIQQHYYVNFTNGAASATANFTTNEAKARPVVLDDMSRVKANGLISNANTILMAGSFGWVLDTVRDVTFTLQLKNKTLTNTIGLSSMANSEIVVDSTMYVSDTLRIGWTGNPLQAGETANCMINRNYDSTSSAYYGSSIGEFRGEGFVFNYEQTRTFPPGIYTITFMRQKTLPLQQSHNGAGGEMYVSIYTTKNVVLR